MSFLLAIIRWILGVFFALSFFVYFKSSPATAVASLVLTGMLIPPLANYIFTKIPYMFSRKALVIFGVVLFVIWVSGAPKTEVKGEGITVTPSPTQKVVVTNTPKPTDKATNTPTLTQVQPKPTNTPSPTQYYPPTPKPTIYIAPTAYSPTSRSTGGGSYTCDCSKTCTQISSCAEAQYQLHSCGCARRDGDGDGIACDNAPLNCQN